MQFLPTVILVSLLTPTSPVLICEDFLKAFLKTAKLFLEQPNRDLLIYTLIASHCSAKEGVPLVLAVSNFYLLREVYEVPTVFHLG